MLLSLALALAADTDPVTVDELPPANRTWCAAPPLAPGRFVAPPPIRIDGFGATVTPDRALGDPASWLVQTPGWVVDAAGAHLGDLAVGTVPVYVDGLRMADRGAWRSVRPR